MKGIILAGGKATRLYPITRGICKQLLPVYDKPMIYYSLSVLMLAGIKDILVISTKESIPNFKNLLGDGSDYGISISYKEQLKPRGIAESFIIGADFIGNDDICLILGDNILYGHGLSEMLENIVNNFQTGANIFAYYVKDPQRYGVVDFDKNYNAVSIHEKPQNPKSNWAITGLYFYDNKVVDIANKLQPSSRGELEITDINKEYLNNNELKVSLLGRGYAWLDTGTYESLAEASLFIKTIEERQGLKIGCIEEVAYNKGYINKEQLIRLAQSINTDYGKYLKSLAGRRI
jgi:glucose-1-phosphate thymidylyltransferase